MLIRAIHFIPDGAISVELSLNSDHVPEEWHELRAAYRFRWITKALP
jgi:hypothetical protein